MARDRGVPFSMENVSVQPGGKPVIGKFLAKAGWRVRAGL
jgi:hypothetical protein